MLVNHDFTQRAVICPDDYHWVRSPQAGVDRVMLDRIGNEKARATSIVRYYPESTFPEHQHPDGEEILVLSGVFSEGNASYPAGWYMRNPPDSTHQPSSHEGATIFVKLRQMRSGEHGYVRIDTNAAENWKPLAGGEECPLYEHQYETVRLVRLHKGGTLRIDESAGGAELLIMDGEIRESGEIFQSGSWIRIPDGETLNIAAGDTGSRFYLKTGHLRDLAVQEIEQ